MRIRFVAAVGDVDVAGGVEGRRLWIGRGLGERFVQIAKERAPSGLQLWMFQVNEPARRFYERHGFVAEQFTDGAGNEVKDARLKWYQVAAAVQPVPAEIETMARMLRRARELAVS